MNILAKRRIPATLERVPTGCACYSPYSTRFVGGALSLQIETQPTLRRRRFLSPSFFSLFQQTAGLGVR